MPLRMLFGLVLTTVGCLAADPDASRIMAQVAANQDKAIQLRRSFVYQQHLLVATRHLNGKLAREEKADYEIAPSEKTVARKLSSISGRYLKKKTYVDFRGEPIPDSESLDGGLVKGFRDDLLNDKSKDGIGSDLFPLTTDEQKKYRFELRGQRKVETRDTYIVAFSPADKNDIDWMGEAWVDVDELQPVRVFTQLSRKLPFLVRTMLGTDVPGVGFNVQYKRIEKDVWFPVSFGSEFRLKAVFFIKRDITISMEASRFQKAEVDSTVQYEPH